MKCYRYNVFMILLILFAYANNPIIAQTNMVLVQQIQNGNVRSSNFSSCINDFKLQNINKTIIMENRNEVIYKTKDKGKTWTNLGREIYISNICELRNGRQVVSTDRGKTWTKINDNEQEEANLIIAPNPVNNFLTIDITGLGYDGINKIYIVDQLGKTYQSIFTNGQVTYKINVSYLDAGVYYLLLNNKYGNIYATKFIKAD